MTSILEHFPSPLVPRQSQIDILERINTHVKSGFKTIILSAPTGLGKSPVAVTLAKSFGRSFVVTASKQLQDQYANDFKFLKPVKGKSNFPCFQLMEKEQVLLSDHQKALSKELTCDKGNCKTTKTQNGKKIIESCKYKPKIDEIKLHVDKQFCLYYKQKFEGLLSPHSLWNYSSYFQLMKFQKEIYSEYLDRPIAIFDEAHTIENQIINFIGITISAKNIEECNINIKSYDLSDIKLILMLIEDIANSYKDQLDKLRENSGNNPDHIKLSKLDSKSEKFYRAFVEISINKDNFVINDPRLDKSSNFNSISIVPLDISQYAGEFFDVPIRIFMSATISKDGFCENMGFSPSEVAFVDTPKSPFLPKNRKIDFLNVTKLSKKNSTYDDELMLIRKIDEIMTLHKSEKGLILTSSLGRCNDIKSNLSSDNKRRIRICHSMNMGKTQNQVLQEHANTDNSVLLSSSLWEGVDLKDDLSRFQIIAKAPYPPLNDKRTRIKIKRFPLWYDSQTIIKLLQGFGRSIRNENDWAVTYVLDSAVQQLLENRKSMVPRAFHDIIWPE